MAKRKKAAKRQRKQEMRQAHQREKRMRYLRYSGLALLLIGAIAAFAFYRVSSTPRIEAPDEIMADNFLGLIDAPVSVVEFGDFGCPSCRAWHNSGIKDQLISEFGDQINFTFRHFPVITRQSPKAAEAGQCASEQDRFWDYHDYIYEQTPQNALSVDELKSYAAALELNTAQFEECLDSGKYSSYVARDQQAALGAGAMGTPTFFINGRQVGFSFETMAATIQQELGS